MWFGKWWQLNDLQGTGARKRDIMAESANTDSRAQYCVVGHYLMILGVPGISDSPQLAHIATTEL
jgi:hypothetical protein